MVKALWTGRISCDAWQTREQSRVSRIPYRHSIQIHCNGVFAQGPEVVTTCTCELLPMYGVTRYTRALLLRTYYGVHPVRLEPVAKPDIPASRLPSTGEEVRSASVVVGISTRSSIKLIHCSALLHTCLSNKLDAKRGLGTGSALCKDWSIKPCHTESPLLAHADRSETETSSSAGTAPT